MATITVTIPPALKRKMDKLAGDGWVKEPVSELLDFILEEARKYPPPKPTYNRTFKLRESWRKEVRGTGGAVLSDGPVYNRYVMAAATQAWMHQGRWQTDESIAAMAVDESLTIFNRFVGEIVNE